MRVPYPKPSWSWQRAESVESKAYRCGYCKEAVASALGFTTSITAQMCVYICPHCRMPTVITNDQQIPGVIYGEDIKHLPQDICEYYDEARTCCSFSAYTASAILCRKLLMNIAVNLGATEGLSFVQYVNYFKDNHHIPPSAAGWVDHVRKVGNEANHQVVKTDREEAERLIAFLGMLLKLIYEYPASIPPLSTQSSTP